MSRPNKQISQLKQPEGAADKIRRRRPKTMEQQELDNRFTYHAPKVGQPEIYTRLRDKAKELAVLLNEVCPESREKALAFTQLEDAVFWANAGIARRG